MAKLTLKQLKEMIRKTVREQINEDLSGGVGLGGTPTRPVKKLDKGGAGGNEWSQGNFSLKQLVDAIKGADDVERERIQAAILQIVGWKKIG